jgi:hypothetical protein
MDVQAPKPGAAAASSTAPQSAKPLKAPKKAKTPIGVIIVAVIVALSLSALTVFAYLKTKDSPSVKDNQKSQAQDRASAGDIDDTTNGVDEGLKSLDDTKDFNDSDLSDTNLGL